MTHRILLQLSLVWPAFAGCNAVSRADGVPPDLEMAAADTVLELAATLHAPTQAAIAAWTSAYARFERDIEPAMRHRCGARTTASVEYAFGRLRLAVVRGDDRRGPAETVRSELSRALPCLKPAEGS